MFLVLGSYKGQGSPESWLWSPWPGWRLSRQKGIGIDLGHPEWGLGELRLQGKGSFWKFCTEMFLEETEQAEGLTLAGDH